jgi:CRP-like cAMP-binding protein
MTISIEEPAAVPEARVAGAGEPTRNHLLAAVAQAAAELRREFEPVELRSGQVLADVHGPLDHAYFPETAVVSLLTVMKDGTVMEAAAIGNEGLVGLSLALGGNTQVDRRTIAQVPGRAVRIPASELRSALQRYPRLHAHFLQYAEALLFQTMQSGGCTKLHSMTKRCARWLLMTHDRVGADTFWLTQQYLAFMLAVRRATVNSVAGALQRAGLIRYRRGRVTIVDRVGLEAESCECLFAEPTTVSRRRAVARSGAHRPTARSTRAHRSSPGSRVAWCGPRATQASAEGSETRTRA